MKEWMRSVGIIGISVIGALGVMSCSSKGAPLPVHNGPEISTVVPTWTLDNVKLQYFPEDAVVQEYMTEFALPEEEMIQWCLDGWEINDGALHSYYTGSDKPYLEIQFRDKKGGLLGTTYPYDCTTKVHKHNERAYISENLGFVHFVVADDTAILKVQPHLDSIKFTCQKGEQ